MIPIGLLHPQAGNTATNVRSYMAPKVKQADSCRRLRKDGCRPIRRVGKNMATGQASSMVRLAGCISTERRDPSIITTHYR